MKNLPEQYFLTESVEEQTKILDAKQNHKIDFQAEFLKWIRSGKEKYIWYKNNVYNRDYNRELAIVSFHRPPKENK